MGSCNTKQQAVSDTSRTDNVRADVCPYAGRDAAANTDTVAATAAIGAAARSPGAAPIIARNNVILQAATAHLHGKFNASNEEKEWKDIKVKLATTSIKGMVILNVGGEKYTTSVDTLTRIKDTFFTALLSNQWELERDPVDKSIFIDRNGKIFTYILEYLRTNLVLNNVMKDEILRYSLLIEAEYFRLHTLIDILAFFSKGTLLQMEHSKKLNEFYGNTNQQWELIYKATRDGFTGNAFHSCCDNKGPTMTIIHSNNNYLFGGYTSISWTSNSSENNDTKAFFIYFDKSSQYSTY
ncbi:unnamed protein product [Adineta steineri]|uniref:TLDc domain-containing protein n=1 Tax=Adineta steineri TaxID=433720 RepID=A0A815QNJ8_9BILA|nr:unnamed protein product [Adineta steineri]